jgi:hypothetical protein
MSFLEPSKGNKEVVHLLSGTSRNRKGETFEYHLDVLYQSHMGKVTCILINNSSCLDIGGAMVIKHVKDVYRFVIDPSFAQKLFFEPAFVDPDLRFVYVRNARDILQTALAYCPELLNPVSEYLHNLYVTEIDILRGQVKELKLQNAQLQAKVNRVDEDDDDLKGQLDQLSMF